MLLSLPDDLYRCVVTEWLEAAALARLDTAVCNSKRRSQYLEFQSSTQVVAENRKSEFFEWAHQRGLGVTRIVLGSAFKASNEWLDCALRNVIQLVVDGTLLKDLTRCLNQCDKLEELKCNDRNIEFFLIKESLLSKLKVLEVMTTEYRPRSTDLSVIAKNCRELQCFSYSFSMSPSNEMALLDLFRHNSLTQLSISVDSNVLLGISLYCSKLMKLTIAGDFSIPSFAQVLTQCRQLVHISAVGSALDCFLDLSQHVLSLRRVVGSGASEFAAAVDVHHLTLQASLAATVETLTLLIDQWSSRLVSLTIEGSQPSSMLRYCVDHCTALMSFIYKCGGDRVVNWKDVLSESNQLERIEIVSSKVDICYILKCCHYLKSASFTGTVVRASELKPYIVVIQEYRHCKTNQSLLFSCRYTLQSSGRIMSLEYDGGGHFSGNLWELSKT